VDVQRSCAREWPAHFARIICHWFSSHERGTISSRWNYQSQRWRRPAGIIAAAAATHFGWRSAFFVPGIICLLGSIYLLWRLRDTPQSVGLPPIEEYKNDYTKEELERRGDTHEAELSTRELFVTYIFKNKLLWLFAAANFFVYVIRYSMLDWAPLYLSEAKGAKLTDGGWAILMLEFGGILRLCFWLALR
jgi:OPA family glycerol-3-phosphate transporter-like MFS transporter